MHIIDEKFWLAIAFLAFVLLIIKYVWPILSNKIDDQSKQIAKDLLEAKEMKELAEKLLQDTKKQHEAALENSKRIIADAESEAVKFIEDSRKTLENEIAKKMAAFDGRIKGEEERAIRDMKTKIVNMALQNAQANLQNVEKESANNIVKKSLDDISKLLH